MLVPEPVVTVTSIWPGEPVGAVAVMVVELSTMSVAAGWPAPKSTAVVPSRLVPVIVTKVPLGPELGLSAETVGGGGST